MTGGPIYVAGTSVAIAPIQMLMAEIAPTDIPVMIIGESGTGKEITALHIHNQSKHRDHEFAKINCSSVRVESPQLEFQGLERRKGTNGNNFVGTVFFDEIGDLDASCQRQLLHSLPDANAVHVNMPSFGRIISCTTHDPEEDIQRGRFRSELFYRLNGVCLRLPPLRQRKEDIPRLVDHFVQKYARLFGRKASHLSTETMDALMEYMWPGNIRELENAVKKLVALGNDELALSDLKTRQNQTFLASSVDSRGSLKAAARAASMKAERELILQTLTRTHWNRKRAAQALQISYKSLLYKLKQIQVPDSDDV
jgi:DNA-binding NtrC family response regulator